MGQKELGKIKEFLDKNKVKYKLFSHRKVHTSEEASKERNVPLLQGVKSLLLITHEKEYILCLVSGDKKIKLKELRNILNTKDIKLAGHEEVLKITGCEVGSVHPFGNLYYKEVKILMDKEVLRNEIIDFSVGTFVNSVEMKLKDFIKILKPLIKEFTIEK